MQVVVTGASGFLGSHLVTALLNEAISVVPVSRRSIELENAVRVEDYSDTPLGDVLIHLAENPNRKAVNGSSSHLDAEAHKLLGKLLSKGYKRVVYVSSAVVYGDAGKYPISNAAPVVCSDTYANSKIACELLVKETEGVVARMSNIYGQGMSLDNVMSTILNQIPCHGRLRIWDDKPVRDFLWVEDAVGALVKMALGTHVGTYNVGSGMAVSIGELARMIISLSHSNGCRLEVTSATDRLSYNVLDISETTKYFGWFPGVQLAEGIKILLDKVELR